MKKVFGSRNERELRRMGKTVTRINAIESKYREFSDEQLRGRTVLFRERLDRGQPIEELLPAAFALVREAGRRTLEMRHFDVQMIGGMVLHEGKIAEMRTGEGKTLVATLSAYFNALAGKGVHIVTVNDYLARRDADWMGQIYSFLGLRTGVIVNGLNQAERREAYGADITYGTNNEFGFDYLRDNMAFSKDDRVQRRLHYAIVDEVDSILIDEARTPLIISGPTEDRTDLYMQVDALVPNLSKQEKEDSPGDYSVDEKARQVYLTEEGHQKVEDMMAQAGLLAEGDSLYSAANVMLMHHLYAGLRAHVLYHRDVEYIVHDGEVIIVDEFTGRTMPGRRWSDGIHQAVEAKERVPIQNENQTLASITFQNYFRLYTKLSGMTGTADTEAYEFQDIYGLEVIVIPTHMPMIRADHGDVVYLTPPEKFKAIVEEIEDCKKRGQPALVGTASIETSEFLSNLLKQDGIEHQVLNAKFHEKEAMIVAQAGRPGSVTIATNMAGRGTDIVLGGSLASELKDMPEADEALVHRTKDAWQERHNKVVSVGGLHIVGTERHESRRIDNQLRGRSGRQGDPGSTRFFLSLQDNLMRIFASERIAVLMQKLGMQEGEAIEHPWVTRAIENAQRKVENRNFDVRKQLLEFDDVANDQRKVIYEQRNELLDAEEISAYISDVRTDVVESLMDTYVPKDSVEEQWNIPGLTEALEQELGLTLDLSGWLAQDTSLDEAGLRQRVVDAAHQAYAEKEQTAGATVMRHFEKAVMLQILDNHWKEHLAEMDYLRQGIHLRGFAGKNAKQEYKREAFEMFSRMLDAIKREVIGILAKVQVRDEAEVEALEEQRRQQQELPMEFTHADAQSALSAPEEAMPEFASDQDTGAPMPPPRAPRAAPFVRDFPKVGRNDPCPCGSGKKYKQCHGALS